MVSIIIPFYNEESILNCLFSLIKQSYSPLEIILVNDGSENIASLKSQISDLKSKGILIRLLNQNHQGPAKARNLGAGRATGDILVFVDADMEFDGDFIYDLVTPIKEGRTIGTFSKEEYLQNKDNIWAVCWNVNRYLTNGWQIDDQVYERVLPIYYPDKQVVFRAILKKQFDKIGGFDNTGYTDDWTLSRKLNKEATAVKGARYCHRNPDSLGEIYLQSKWIGKSEYLTRNITRKIFNLFRYSFPISLSVGLFISLKYKIPQFVIFKIIYDFGISVSIYKSLINIGKLYK
ncbi:hypothetical protein COV53_02055 [Candidatus Gottesmanbacteria bacterium CG11_big_fil_rev_8_21_14_0_20_37_11]|uniref:Glycosyltransferase 2-like domain-containing protein n=2 Tax=Candidatus Gottesmaniibacteriota TaxID=1752720 RepID=A0A2M7RST6_9BACT|nr:MAG: hypothetical protein COX23_06055 [Candidatus Gottesmanbacteria bacterium CG23_combo_of_CG06-09_8_20_14_all_37_19]PIR08624.1 MAG: hypothetical protein COV53_02055 [Candidatus Gottesmanbacteria bacterium CG11_big_fil_rev_8_21_14_0_20_37_11]PIZ03290.1 MAG: hypothetical protein COY59_00255 [Candidatus Gottesmanbacteria bacterium CG_4_10_14_0_8_um_filter_37_24]